VVAALDQRTFSRVGRRLPAHAGALGKALLAERADDQPPLPEGELEAGLAATRERGYAVDREEGVLGIAGFGFALRYDTPATDAISCSVPVPVARLTEEHERGVVPVMRT
jgi:DNA-binding IclR family transcriptional regulator